MSEPEVGCTGCLFVLALFAFGAFGAYQWWNSNSLADEVKLSSPIVSSATRPESAQHARSTRTVQLAGSIENENFNTSIAGLRLRVRMKFCQQMADGTDACSKRLKSRDIVVSSFYNKDGKSSSYFSQQLEPGHKADVWHTFLMKRVPEDHRVVGTFEIIRACSSDTRTWCRK